MPQILLRVCRANKLEKQQKNQQCGMQIEGENGMETSLNLASSETQTFSYPPKKEKNTPKKHECFTLV